ncbi:MAG: DUF5706 domain-containing protein [Flavobacteriales bacterium]|jgi:predicted metal-dependent HD superfamily phosphohydrolase|nr:DUF5706 domain-containing protein [Flavobacteriales bacterium]
MDIQNENQLIADIYQFVKKAFDENKQRRLFYHNMMHTEMVFDAAIEISQNTEGVSEEDIEHLKIAILFHDIAYVKSCENHEDKSAIVAQDYLLKMNYPENKVQKIMKLIQATNLQHDPQNILEKIIKDADLVHLGNTDYIDTSFEDLYKEVKELMKPEMSNQEWATSCVDFLKTHKYHTEYAKREWEPKKSGNLHKLNHLMNEIMIEEKNRLDTGKESEENNNTNNNDLKSSKKKKKKKDKGDRPDRGIETMFRVSLRNHLNLSRIADNKANTMISVNAIIISIVLSLLFPKLDNNPFLAYAGITLLVSSIISIILATISTIPKTTHGLLSKEDVENKKGNLLFFGNFHKMSLEDYEWGIQQLMNDKDYLYNSLSRDLFFLGKVLHKKYKLLRYTYYVFVIGLCVSIIVFIYSLRCVAEGSVL